MIPDNETSPQEAAILDAFIAKHPFAQVDPLALWIAEKRDLYSGCKIRSANAQNVALGLLDALEQFCNTPAPRPPMPDNGQPES